MSGEGEQSQPKAAPKAPTITSAFINKGAKTFAPRKVVRRRPAAPAAPKPTVPSSSNFNPVLEETSQTPSQTRADSTPVLEQPQAQIDHTLNIEQSASAQSPTPTTTQEPIRQDVPPTEEVHVPPTVVADTSAPDAATESSSTPASTIENTTSQPKERTDTSAQPASRAATSPIATAENESERSPQRQRSEAPEERQTQLAEPEAAVADPVATAQQKSAYERSAEDVQPDRTADPVAEYSSEAITQPAANVTKPAEVASYPVETPVDPAIYSETTADTVTPTHPQNAASENIHATQTTAEPAEERSWNAVNAAVGNEEGSITSRKPTGRRKRKAVTLRNMDEEEDEEARRREAGEVEDDYVPPRSNRPSAKARGKRKAAGAPTDEEDGTVQLPPKKKRQLRKAKATAPTPAESGQDVTPGMENEISETCENAPDVENSEPAENGEGSRSIRPTPSRKRKRQSTSQPNGEGEQQPRRKGRPPRAPTPSDAEDEVIDEDNFFMEDLARRNIRIGKLSQREKKMREINWEEVKQRQKEKEAEQMNSRAVHAEMERQAQEKENAVRTVQEQVRYEMVGGEMRIVQGSGQVNYEEIAETRYAEEVVEEDDFTNRITSRSFMRNNKRFPEEFLLPGQGKRWDIRSTQDFYDALRMFGTDFGMMTTLFEGVSRRSLKLKFNREERKQPAVIKEILQQKDTRLGNWDEFLKASGKESEQYDRVEQIKMDLVAAEEDAKRQIEEARAEFEEDRRQRRLAGFMSDEEGGENEAGKKKKGKKGKEKQVTFQQEEEGVEVLEVDENDGWGED
ncbi:hypothetical protein SLS60_003047 [Paraconiothyrium brasiliense]|uniref:Transcription factor TFIIIB component B'' Myb domain-containing protein n=1 Tax=Paraconiothyrium brasiliense TaxID=300254 RepID=A0ABR3RUK5_9PLEO